MIPKRKPKKRSVSTAKAAAWGWMSKYIRAKAADSDGIAECVTCKARKPWKEMQAGHFVPKARGGSVYFLEANIHVQCDVCNRWNGGRLIEYTRFMQETYGPEIVDHLLDVSRETVHRKLADYESIEQEYKSKFEELQHG